MTGWFQYFPNTFTYANTTCVEMTEGVALLQSISQDQYIYYPYDIVSNERADQFANRYYGNPFLSWILYLSNDIYDPIRGWYLNTNDFNSLITLKYGSLQLAIQKTKFFRNNWVAQPSIFPNGFNALNPILQEYWQPIVTGYQVTSYQRIPVNWQLDTNMIVSYVVNTPSFSYDEVVDIIFYPGANGQGQVLSINNSSNTVYIQHVNGQFNQNLTSNIVFTGNSYIFGEESLTNTTISTNSSGFYIAPDIIAQNISEVEQDYWAPVSYFEYENELNEQLKSIRVLDNRFTSDIVNNLQSILANT
jgi:hypothetical protein